MTRRKTLFYEKKRNPYGPTENFNFFSSSSGIAFQSTNQLGRGLASNSLNQFVSPPSIKFSSRPALKTFTSFSPNIFLFFPLFYNFRVFILKKLITLKHSRSEIFISISRLKSAFSRSKVIQKLVPKVVSGSTEFLWFPRSLWLVGQWGFGILLRIVSRAASSGGNFWVCTKKCGLKANKYRATGFLSLHFAFDGVTRTT